MTGARMVTDSSGRESLAVTGARGKVFLTPEFVFIRACDRRAFIASTDTPPRTLDVDEVAMVAFYLNPHFPYEALNLAAPIPFEL